MIRRSDRILFSFPIIATVILIALSLLLYWQISNFEESYINETKEVIAEETRLVADIVTPLLNQNKLDEAIKFCDKFDSDYLRITLIDDKGKVAADSDEVSSLLGNHLNREEVQGALRGVHSESMRYSESLNQWMMYSAVMLNTKTGVYILRTAISTDNVQNIIAFARMNMFWALLFGGQIVLLILFYIFNKVRKPLLSIQKSVGAIANGRLSTNIEIPANGVLRDLAIGIVAMTEQLKKQLYLMTTERNEREVLLDSMDEGVLLVSQDGNVLSANPAAARIFHFPVGKLKFNIGRCQIPDLFEFAGGVFINKKPFEREFFITQFEVKRSLYIKGSLIEKDGKELLLLTVTDLTKLKNLESFRSDFIANVSHEIKTPLTCIICATEALEEEEQLDETQKKHLLQMLKSHSERLNTLIHDILSLATLEKLQKDCIQNFEDIRLDIIIGNATNICQEKLSDSNIKLHANATLPIEIKGDYTLLEQAIINLIENAIKYSNGKNIEISLKKEDDKAKIEVKDDGVGIAVEHQERIFERFYRIDKSRSRELGGTGLGLAIVKHTIQLHNGEIKVISSLGSGATFHLELPL